MTNKSSQAIRCWWHVRRWGRVGPGSGESFRRVGRGKVSTIAIVNILDALYKMICLDRYLEKMKKGPTHLSKRACLGRDRLSNSVIPIHLHVWNLRNLRILICVSVRKEI